VETLVCP